MKSMKKKDLLKEIKKTEREINKIDELIMIEIKRNTRGRGNTTIVLSSDRLKNLKELRAIVFVKLLKLREKAGLPLEKPQP